jgi:division protein CdvB (Snf7/Vps24/ESCRT-III family)
LDREEKRVAAEMKRLAKLGQNASVKVLAKEIIRIRSQREKIYKMKGQLSAVNTRTRVLFVSSFASNIFDYT